MHLYQNPILNWAIKGEGEPPSKAKAKVLLTHLKDSHADAVKLVADLDERHKRALSLLNDVEKGIDTCIKYIDGKPGDQK